jgi:hypothetical protein
MGCREGHWEWRDLTFRVPPTLNTYPVLFVYSRVRWSSTDHGPQTWPWWRLISWTLCDLEGHEPSTRRRLWFYTRWGCWFFDLFIDRRELR